MRFSENFGFKRNQSAFDFVDVPLDTDLPVFLDPTAIRNLNSKWGHRCASLIQHYFSAVLKAVKDQDEEKAVGLLSCLKERNEFHLGLSQGASRGSGFGSESAKTVWAALIRSKASKSGLLQDLEDSCLLIEGIGHDRISDAVCNIIRGPLIKYTQDMCTYYGIPLTPDVDSGPVWNPADQSWNASYVPLPMTEYGKVILVPKIAVRYQLNYDCGKYYTHYLLPAMQRDELKRSTTLVQLLKNGKRRVTKKSLREEYGESKLAVVENTLRFPDVLEKYRSDKGDVVTPPVRNEDLEKTLGGPPTDWDVLKKELNGTKPGKEEAGRYEDVIEQILTSLFYPSLCSPTKQHKIHDGRKRVDITYTNEASEGFFAWLAANFPCSNVFVECKNYGKEVGNPEVDQLAGRFSPSRGKFGILVVRSLDNPDLLAARLKDTAKDDRGYIVALTDEDIGRLIDMVSDGQQALVANLLRPKFEQLIM